MNETFINYINKLKKIDFIIIAGDYFDHKLYLNDKSSEIALLFMDKLIDIIKKHNCPLRIIYGTEAHEVNQYNMFKLYEDDINLNFKIIKTVTKEELLPNLKVLYVPEEYTLDKNEYYKDYFNDKYNYVFGHGTIQELVGFNTKNIVKKEKLRKKVPIFTSTELENICDGQVYFGHYHINTNIKNKIFYVGSYSRWRFGEEEPKGFYHITYDSSKNKYNQVFIENQLAKTYITYTFGYDSKVINSENDIIEELTKLDKLNEFKKYDYIRYIFNIP
ncbi:MAG TPA: hypothetical protein DCG28_04830, partial [Lachnospiraceae bacterium]|nr:hypothetical protein [Lachnospiraceae bacterium]